MVEGQSDLGAVNALIGYLGHQVGVEVVKNGKANLDRDLHKYYEAARREAWVVFRDTDSECPVTLSARLGSSFNDHGRNFRLRLAHSMTEAWLLSDREAFSRFFRVREGRIPRDPEQVADAKELVLSLCAQSSSRRVREAMVRGNGEVGALYVSTLNQFATTEWRAQEAIPNSESLRRAAERIATLR